MADPEVKPDPAAPAATPGAGGGGSNADPKGGTPGDGKSPAGAPAGGGQGAPDPSKGGSDKKPEGAPEKYEAFKLPEGIELDKGLVEEFQTVAKEMNLNQANAQRFVDIQVKALTKTREEIDSNFQKMKDSWESESKKLLGAEPEKSLATVKRAVDAFGSPELSKLMEESGLGNHPALISFLLKAGKEVREDQLPGGAGGSAAPKSAAETLYPSKA